LFLFFSAAPRPSRSTLFPYTTLFRSLTLMLVVTSVGGFLGATGAGAQDRPVLRFGSSEADIQSLDPHVATGTQDRTIVDMVFNRSEEHTSELQSRENLVCRLLLEKKN